MRPIPSHFQEAIRMAKAEGARTLSLRGDGKKDGDNVLFEVPEAVFSLEGLEELDLSHNMLDRLPAGLEYLKEIDLVNNPLQCLPDQGGLMLSSDQYIQHQQSIDSKNIIGFKLRESEMQWLDTWLGEGGSLTHLQYLEIGETSIASIPDFICKLTKLTGLYLMGNKISAIPDSIGKLTKLTKLVLGNNEISTLPDSIGKLTNLIKLVLGNNEISTLPDSIGKLTNLTVLNLRNNKISTLPDSICKLTKLTMLYLGFNNISTLPDSINKLTNLIALNLSNNKISTLPDSIGKLTKLTVLNLSNNKVSTLPDSIYKLTSLTKLDLSNNEISTLPDFICMLTNLTVLNLGNNKISTLPNSSYGLTNLTKLGLNNNEISTLPDSICTLTNLTILNLSNNKISTLPDAICKLTSLTGLGLNNNEIFTLSDSISKLTNLTELGLNNNEISTLPDSICKLTSLTKLSLYGNEISTLPDSISKLINLTLINLKNNPLETPPLAIVEEGISAIQAFFRDRQNEGILLHEARILIVGEPGAGKTTLMKKLRNPDYKLPEDGEDSTLGIQVEKNWSFPDCNQPSIRFKTHIWDFGGQEIQYMTHQFFLRPRSLYVLVCDNRKQDAEFDYWFKVINLMGKGCPVLVVLNARNYQATTNFDLAYYRDLYPELTIDQYAVDLGKMDDRGRLNHLLAAIQKSVCNLPHIGEKLPEAWIPIREQLEAQKDRHHISYSELAAICAKHGLTREDSVLLVSTYLDALGLIVHFQNDGALHDFVVIDPQWVVNAIYALLDDTTVQNQKGYFSQSWINQLWQSKGYSHIERLRFISLMEQDNFELCFAVKDCDEHQYIVPQLLPKVAPQYEWNDDHNLHFRINYPTFMPKGIMARLIVRLNDLLTHEGNRPMIWKLGMLLQAHGCKAAVLHKPDNQLGGESIFIRVAGHALHRKTLLMEIRKQLQHIHSRSFKNLNANEYIPCCGSRCSASETPCFFKFTSLITTLENRRSTHYCETCNEDIDIGEMIGSAIVIKEQEDETMSDKIMAGERGHQQTINFSPNISIDSRLISRQTTEVSISIEIQTINAFAGKLGLLKKNLLKGVADPSQKKLLKDTFAEVEASTKTLKKAEETKTKQDESAVMQLQDFVEDLHDADTTLGKAVSSVENGAKHAKKLGQLYNKIASFTGMPVIPLIGL